MLIRCVAYSCNVRNAPDDAQPIRRDRDPLRRIREIAQHHRSDSNRLKRVAVGRVAQRRATEHFVRQIAIVSRRQLRPEGRVVPATASNRHRQQLLPGFIVRPKSASSRTLAGTPPTLRGCGRMRSQVLFHEASQQPGAMSEFEEFAIEIDRSDAGDQQILGWCFGSQPVAET